MRAYLLLAAVLLLAVVSTTAKDCGPYNLGTCTPSPKSGTPGREVCGEDEVSIGDKEGPCFGKVCCFPKIACTGGTCARSCNEVATEPDTFMPSATAECSTKVHGKPTKLKLACCVPKPTHLITCKADHLGDIQGQCKQACRNTEMPMPSRLLSQLCSVRSNLCCFPAKCSTSGKCVTPACSPGQRAIASSNGECAPGYKCCQDRPTNGEGHTYTDNPFTFLSNRQTTTTPVSAYKYPATTSGVPVTENCYELMLRLRTKLPKPVASAPKTCMVGLAKIGGEYYYAASSLDCRGADDSVTIDFYGDDTTIHRVNWIKETIWNGKNRFDDDDQHVWTCAAAQLQYEAKRQGKGLACLVEMYRENNEQTKAGMVIESCPRCKARLASDRFFVHKDDRLYM